MIETLSGRTRGRQYSPTRRIWKIAIAANASSIICISWLLAILELISSESARPGPGAASDPHQAAADQVTSETFTDTACESLLAALITVPPAIVSESHPSTSPLATAESTAAAAVAEHPSAAAIATKLLLTAASELGLSNLSESLPTIEHL